MSIQNPTTLRLGLRGELSGRRYRLAARVVLSIGEGEEEYFWNEFRLVDESGAEATLVFEETERGPSWKLFQYFEPGRALGVEELRGLCAGQSLSLDGLQAKIEYVDRSRVRHIEGEPPEGVCVGDQADFLNAWMGDDMLVVSWTGAEVECYLGQELPERSVREAFGHNSLLLRKNTAPGLSSALSPGAGSSEGFGVKYIKLLVVCVLFLALLGLLLAKCGSSAEDTGGARRAPEAALSFGKECSFEGHRWTVRYRSMVEFAAAEKNTFARVYTLTAENGAEMQLMQGMPESPATWVLLREVEGPAELNPTLAASYTKGRLVVVQERQLNVLRLLRLRVVQAEGTGPLTGVIRYGFWLRDAKGYVLVDWNEKGIRYRTAEVWSRDQMKQVFGVQ